MSNNHFECSCWTANKQKWLNLKTQVRFFMEINILFEKKINLTWFRPVTSVKDLSRLSNLKKKPFEIINFRNSHCAHSIRMQRNSCWHTEAFAGNRCKNGGQISTANHCIAGMFYLFVRNGTGGYEESGRTDSRWWNEPHFIRAGKKIRRLHIGRFNWEWEEPFVQYVRCLGTERQISRSPS